MNKIGHLVVSRKKIACNYIKCWFWVDFLASFPFFLFTSMNESSLNQGFKTAKILRVINIVRLFRLAKLVKEFLPKITEQHSKKYFMKFKKNSERLVVHSFIVLIICHLFACLMYALPMEVMPNSNWVTLRELQNNTAFEKYLFSMHWMVETIITVGYGENTFK